MSNKIITLNNLDHFYDKINDRFIPYYKELVNDAEEGSLAIITNSEAKSINDSMTLTEFNLPDEVDNSIPTDLYIRRNNTWQNITDDIDWLKNPNNKQDTLVSGTNIKTINGESLLGAGNIVINGSGSGISEISGLINLKDPERVKEVQLSLADKQYKTFIVTDSNGNYPSPLVNTVYLDDMNGLMDLFYRGNDLALKNIFNNGEVYYKYLDKWSSENIRNYIKLPQFNLQTVKVGDLVTIIRHDFTSDEFYSKYIDFNSIIIDNSIFQTAKTLAGYGNKSDGEYIKYMMVSGNIYSAESDPNNSSVTAYPLSIDGKVQFYTAQITPNTQNVYSGEFWTGNMTGPGIYTYVNNVEPNPGIDSGEVFIGYVSPNGAQTLISMKNPSKVFTRPNLYSSWNLGGVQKIINDDLYRTKYSYSNIADSCLKTGVNAYFNDTIGGISGNWSLFVTCSFDGDSNNYYHLLQTAVGRDANSNLGKIFQRMGWYRGDGEDLNFTEWITVDYDIQANELTLVTYAELKEMRDNGDLIVGHLYRITDYEFTTLQSSTKSAGHPFDIIVLATAENQLSELARAIQHEGDTYFDGNDLGAWELWYDLDNDTNKYEWADTENGKGVIYRMIDEKHNDCHYDFKNALFHNTKLTTNTTADKYYYTFSYVVSGKLYDGTVEGQVKNCYGNSMEVYLKSGKKSLNLNIFKNTSFLDSCYSNTFGTSCYHNTFGDGCYYNTFGNYCNYNTFGNYCYSNTFGNYCYHNTFVNSCYYNTFVNSCYYNTFGNYCYSNTFGNYCYSNTFGNYCNSNTFGNYCYSNTFGNYCNSNTFVNYCYSNTFGNSCYSNTFGNNVTNRKIDSNKISITLNDEYYDDGSGQLVPVKHPDLSTQPSILPYKFMGQYVYEQLIPVKVGDRVVGCNFEVEYPMILSAGAFGVNSFKNVDIMATKSDALLLNTESESAGYINVKYTDGSQLLSSNGYSYGYGYEDNNTESSALVDFGLSPDGTIYAYDPNTEVLSLYKSGEITQESIPQNLPKKNIILNDGVTNIGVGAFSNCSSLTSINIPESVTSIGDEAFSGCNSLTSIILPKGVTNIGNYTFNGCSSLTDIILPEGVTNIGESAFSGCSNLTDIILPEGVTSIGDEAFWGCRNLTSIIIPEGVTSIGKWTFGYCSSLTDIILPEGVTNIGESAFRSCGKLISINIPEHITSIEANVFYGCSSLTDIILPEGVTNIGNYAFYNCSSLTSINIPERVTNIGNYAFYNCSSLTSINIPESVTNIGESTFYGCSSLMSITIPESVTNIGVSAFSNCSSLTSINIPESVTNIANFTFYGCSSLTDIHLPESVTNIGNYAFYNCSSLTSINIPESVTNIGERAFYGCSSLTDIHLPESVTSIGERAFYNCSSLTSINIPERVTSIGNSTFYNCKGLTSITSKAITPPSVFSTISFYGVDKSISVYVPAESVDAYKAAEVWKDFTNIQAI